MLASMFPVTQRQFAVKWMLLIFLWGVFIVDGCTKHTAPGMTTVSTNAEASANANPVAAIKPPVSPAVVSSSADPAPMLAQLTQVLRRFSVEHRRVPKSLNELVAAGYLAALPAAPAGKQFAIEPKHLEVVLQ